MPSSPGRSHHGSTSTMNGHFQLASNYLHPSHDSSTAAASASSDSDDRVVYTPPHLKSQRPAFGCLRTNRHTSSSDDHGDDLDESDALEDSNYRMSAPLHPDPLSIVSPAQGYQRKSPSSHAIVSQAPFSRPPSTVSQPSRPGTAFPPGNGRVAPGRQQHHKVQINRERYQGVPRSGPGESTERSNDKGKGKAVKPHVTWDPLDPLSALRIDTVAPEIHDREDSSPVTLKASSPNQRSALPFPIESASLASSSSASGSGLHPTPNRHPVQPQEQQSLQEILQTVDLGAALKLVQALQHQPAASNISSANATGLSKSTSSADLDPALPRSPTGSSLHAPEHATRERKLSTSLPLRPRSQSIASVNPGLRSDERNFEGQQMPTNLFKRDSDILMRAERISKVHLSLSPATLRRARDTTRAINARYPLPDNVNLLQIARWKTFSSSSNHARKDSHSEGRSSGLSSSRGSFGRSHRCVWDVRSDDIVAFTNQQNRTIAFTHSPANSLSHIFEETPVVSSPRRRVPTSSLPSSPQSSNLLRMTSSHTNSASNSVTSLSVTNESPGPMNTNAVDPSSPAGVNVTDEMSPKPVNATSSGKRSLGISRRLERFRAGLGSVDDLGSAATATDGGYKSSGGEGSAHDVHRLHSSGRLRRRWRGWAHGLRYGSGGEGDDAAHEDSKGEEERVENIARPRAGKRSISYFSDDEEDNPKIVREVVDLANEDFEILSSLHRQLRTHVTHADALIPRVPQLLIHYLDALSAHETNTQKRHALPVSYTFPRLSAAVVAEIARAKVVKGGDSSPIVSDEEEDIVTSSSASLSGSSHEYSDEDLEDTLDLASDRRSKTVGVSWQSARQRSISRSRDRPALVSQNRRVTDPTKKGSVPYARARSQTVAGPTKDVRMTARNAVEKRDTLEILERAIEDLTRASHAVDDEIRGLSNEQQHVGDEIKEVVKEVDEIQRDIDEVRFQQVRNLEDHLYRLRMSQSRPGLAVDFFWALLSYVLTGLFWLSWFLVVIFRMTRGIILFPITVIRWFFLIQ